MLEQHELEMSGRMLGLLLAVAADTEAATATLAAMKERGVPATHDTFAKLLRVYASSRLVVIKFLLYMPVGCMRNPPLLYGTFFSLVLLFIQYCISIFFCHLSTRSPIWPGP